MSFLGKILGGDVLKNVNNIVDELHSSPVEKKELKIKLKEVLAKAESNAQEQVTRRWEADSKAGWLPANIRPIYAPIYQTLLMVVYSAYFAGRSVEKIKKK